MLADPQVQHCPHLQRGEENRQENQRDGQDRLKGLLPSLSVKVRQHSLLRVGELLHHLGHLGDEPPIPSNQADEKRA
jgi:hypothetical protein